MNLHDTTQAALDLTRRLSEALERDDLSLCTDLLQQRSIALRDFEICHRGATSEALLACQESIRELVQLNGALQVAAEQNLVAVAADFRNGLGSTGPAPIAYRNEPQQACVDRKA